jgi:hypothetical protein
MSVPRGAYHGGGGAARHPQPGYGYSYGHGHGGYGHGGYGHGHGAYYGHSHGYYHGHGHYPYYGYRYGYYPYYPYYGYGYGYPYGSAGLYLGLPYVGASINYYSGGAPYAYGTPPPDDSEGPPPEESAPAPAPQSQGTYQTAPRADAPGYTADTGRVRLDARPGDASVYVDDDFWGSARDSRVLTLRSGRHTFEVVRPGHATVRRDVDIARGGTVNLVVDLERSGASSSY